MTKKSMDPSDTSMDHAPASVPEPALNTQTATEFALLLKSVLQSLGSGLPPPPPPPPPAPPPLPQKALDALAEFRRISADLRVATVFTA